MRRQRQRGRPARTWRRVEYDLSKLPDEITAETLVLAGADAVSAYAVAQQEAVYLGKVSNWVAQTRELPGHTSDPDRALRILRPNSALQLAKLDEATWKPADPTLHALDPVLLTAAREGVTFGINTLRQCAEIRSGLASDSAAAVTDHPTHAPSGEQPPASMLGAFSWMYRR